MSFTKGLVGVIGGLVIFVLAGLLFGMAQFAAPAAAALFMWLAVLGLVVAIVAPIYYWAGLPLWRFARRQNA